MKIYLKKIIVLWTLSFFSFSVNAAQFQNATYKDAEKSTSFVRFDMSSSKLGFITTSFTGFVKNFKLSGELNKGILSNAGIEFLVQDLDTDSSGRNDKMWNYCFNMKENPIIRIKLKKDIVIGQDYANVPATFFLRGSEKEIDLDVKAVRLENGDLEFDLSGVLSLKALEIPDPSIAIASVKDAIKVHSHFIVTP